MPNSEKLKEDPKLHFYYIFSKWKWTRHFIPLKVFLWWNAFSYKHDAILYKIEQKWDNFTNFWFYPFRKFNWWHRDNLSGLGRRLKNVWDYAKLAWNDADWDYIYLLNMLKFKIDRMEKTIRKYDRHIDTQDYCDQMKIVSECLNFVIEDRTNLLMKEEIDNKFLNEESIENWLTNLRKNKIVEMDKQGKKNVYFISETSDTEDSEEYRQEFKRLSHYYDSLKTAHLRVAFHIMLPALLSAKEYDKINKENREIYEKYGYNNEETLKLVKKIHSGIYSWWD